MRRILSEQRARAVQRFDWDPALHSPSQPGPVSAWSWFSKSLGGRKLMPVRFFAVFAKRLPKSTKFRYTKSSWSRRAVFPELLAGKFSATCAARNFWMADWKSRSDGVPNRALEMPEHVPILTMRAFSPGWSRKLLQRSELSPAESTFIVLLCHWAWTR